MASEHALEDAATAEQDDVRSWWGVSSLVLILLQSLCTAVMAVSGVRLVIGLGALAAAAWVPSAAEWFHQDAIRIPMMILAVAGSVVNLYVIWRIRSLRGRSASRWRARPVSAKQRRGELVQIALAVLTLVLVAAEWVTHRIFFGAV